MSLEVPEHVRPLREKMLRFVEDEIYPIERAYFKHGPEWPEISTRIRARAKERGLWALGHPKSMGGGGVPWSDYTYINEVIGRSDAAVAAVGSYTLQTCLLLDAGGTPEQKKEMLYPTVAGEMFVAFSVTEPGFASSDPTNIQTTARLEGDEWVINGRKWYASHADEADWMVVMCRTEDDPQTPYAAFSMIAVPTKADGLTLVRDMHVMGLTHSNHPEYEYTDVRVPARNLIGARGEGFRLFQVRLGPARMTACTRFLGQMQRAFDLMNDRINTRRVAGGALLAEKQLMKKHVFDSYTDIQASRSLVLNAAEKLERGEQARVEVGVAKTFAARALMRVIDRAIQVHGALGVSDDTPLETMYRLARLMPIIDGPDEVHIDRTGKIILREYADGRGWDFGLR